MNGTYILNQTENGTIDPSSTTTHYFVVSSDIKHYEDGMILVPCDNFLVGYLLFLDSVEKKKSRILKCVDPTKYEVFPHS